MNFNDREKAYFSKIATSILKQNRGKGPKNIYFNYLEKEVHVHANVNMTYLERKTIEYFIREGKLDELNRLFQGSCIYMIKQFNDILEKKYIFVFEGFESNYNDENFCVKLRLL